MSDMTIESLTDQNQNLRRMSEKHDVELTESKRVIKNLQKQVRTNSLRGITRDRATQTTEVNYVIIIIDAHMGIHYCT